METFGNILNKAITSSWKDDLDFLSDERMAFNLTSHFRLTVSRGDNKGHRLVAPSGYAKKNFTWRTQNQNEIYCLSELVC